MLIDCLERQTFRGFEVCIADDCSTDSAVRPFLESLYEREIQVRLTFLEKNGHISVASNAAAALATGKFLVLVDQDDLIPVEALEIVAQTIEEHPNCAVLFSDEDKIDVANNRSDPYFKGSFDNFLLYGHNMVSHLGVYSRELFRSIGGFTVGLEGAQDYDLALRAYEALGGESRIVHIPYVLYHWRIIPGSTALDSSQKEYAIVAAQKAINSHFKRCNLPYRSDDTTFARGTSHVTIVKSDRKSDLISFIIPSKNNIQTLDSCIRSLYATNDGEFEVIIVDNGSDRADVITYLHQLETSYPNTHVVYFPGSFNYSAMNNMGRRSARGSILGLLNNDTEVIALDFMDRVRAHLRSKEIGIVGARLFYENFSVQHFGIYLGIGEHAVAGAAHHGSHRSDPGPYAKGRLIQQFEAVTAACLFTRTETYDRVDGFDESFPVAYNDIDFCLKVRSLGLKIICDPDIEFFHKESFSRGLDTTPEKASRLASEGERMHAKWASVLCNDRFYSPNFSNENTSMQLAFPPRLFPFVSTS